MGFIVERHQVVFINPDLSGLFSAYLTQRAGIKIAIINEAGGMLKREIDFPTPFPAAGTFHPYDVDILATDSGFPPPVWERIPRLLIYATDHRIPLNADDGPGGFLLTLKKVFRHDKSVWIPWLQDQLAKSKEFMDGGDRQRLKLFKRLEGSVADSILELKLNNPEPLLTFFDILCILIVGRGIVQLDIRDLRIVLSGFFTGWHIPAPGEKDLVDIITNRIKKGDVKWHDAESVVDIDSISKRLSVVTCSDGTRYSGNIIVVPQGNRYHMPAIQGNPDSIKWEDWHCHVGETTIKNSFIGLICADEKRPPVNDNFISFHFRPSRNGAVTLSIPVEERYSKGADYNRFNTKINRAKYLLKKRLGWHAESLARKQITSPRSIISLPGITTSVSYPEGPVWGDDIYTRLRAADRLSNRIVEGIEG